MSEFFWFADAQWSRIEPLLPVYARGKERVDDRRVLSGIVHAIKNGGRWADCPREVYGPKKTLCNRFVRWAERGVWEDVFAAPGGRGRRAGQAVHRLELYQGPPLRRRRKRGALAQGIGKTKGGRNNKLHALCDERGRPLVLMLTPGNVHDAKVAMPLIDALPPTTELVADKGYDSKVLRDWLEERGTTPVIPPRKGRLVQYDYDRDAYRHRNVVERMFCRLKDFRRVATRLGLPRPPSRGPQR